VYRPTHFEPASAAEMHALMREHPLAIIASTAQDGSLTADHVPLEFVAEEGPHGVLRGHVARANPLWRAAAGQPVMAVFRGAEAYVSPSWYPSKAATHKVVPTWNYSVVHAHGSLRVVEDAPWLHALISRLTGQHEAGRTEPWAVTDAPEDYIAQMLRAIVGIEIPVERLQGKFKLSQNRSAEDREGVIRGLAAEPREAAVAMAGLIRDRQG
jgi:transcriptional regulator